MSVPSTPAAYLNDAGVFPNGVTTGLMAPHFIDDTTLPLMRRATEGLTTDEAADLYERFLHAREAAIIAEIRRVCGTPASRVAAIEPLATEELASDVRGGESSVEDEAELNIA